MILISLPNKIDIKIGREELKMNGIQKYLMNEATNTILVATGNLIKDAELDPVLVVTSMKELLVHLERMSVEIQTEIEFPFEFNRLESRIKEEDRSNLKPVFLKPL